jgi:class 3 adenylate cyclase
MSILRGQLEALKDIAGVLDKFIGDGVLAYFGYNSETKNGNPCDAINAALEFRIKFHKLRKEFADYCSRNNGIDASKIDLKCAMDNGPAYIHYFNSDTRNYINIIGSTVNLASRLEDLARNDEIIISKRLKNMIHGKFDLLEIKAMDRITTETIKGRGGVKSFEEQDYIYNVIGKKTRK